MQQSQNAPPDNRTYSVFFVTLRMIKNQFRMNNYKQSETLFKWIDMQFRNENFTEDCLPQSWRVQHAYLKGRSLIYQNDYKESRKYLRFAFENCHNNQTQINQCFNIENYPQFYVANKQKILKFLIPIEMNLYNFPTEQLLVKYDLKEYVGILQACMTGNMTTFEKTLEDNMDYILYVDYFVKGGVFMTVEKLRHLTLRNLVKKVAGVVESNVEEFAINAASPHVIRLDILFNILRDWDSELDMDELESLMANLIYLGYVKGYISHEKRLMVLAKVDPFPLKIE